MSLYTWQDKWEDFYGSRRLAWLFEHSDDFNLYLSEILISDVFVSEKEVVSSVYTTTITMEWKHKQEKYHYIQFSFENGACSVEMKQYRHAKFEKLLLTIFCDFISEYKRFLYPNTVKNVHVFFKA
jgi:hypothetical protein